MFYKEDYIGDSQILSFSPSSVKHKNIMSKLENYIKFIDKGDDKLKKNYSGQSFNLHNQKLISVFLKNNKMKYFSTVFNRPFYGHKTFRILNRAYRDKSLRTVYTKIIPETLKIIEHQFNYAKSIEADSIFISREGKCKKFINKLGTVISDYLKVKWKNPNKKVLVCPDQISGLCHHWITFYSFNGTDFNLRESEEC